MSTVNIGRGVGRLVGIGVGLLALALVGASPALAGPSTTRMTSESVNVIGVDRTARTLTLQNVDGDVRTVDVPAEVKAFDTVKVGDHVDISYSESVALSLAPAGSKPSTSTSTSGMKTSTTGAARSRQMTASAEVVSIDRVNNKVTFKGPRGNTETVAVSDPALQRKLVDLKPGQVVQITYTESVAASIRPAPMAAPPVPKTP
jgi:hypothetical protein